MVSTTMLIRASAHQHVKALTWSAWYPEFNLLGPTFCEFSAAHEYAFAHTPGKDGAVASVRKDGAVASVRKGREDWDVRAVKHEKWPDSGNRSQQWSHQCFRQGG